MFLAWSPTPEFWALMGIVATGLLKFLYELRKDVTAAKFRELERKAEVSKREQTRLDIEALARLTEDQFEKLRNNIDENGQIRLKRLLESNVTTRVLAKKAFTEANNVNAKIASLGQALVDSSQVVQQVEVTNTASHPIPTTTIPNDL